MSTSDLIKYLRTQARQFEADGVDAEHVFKHDAAADALADLEDDVLFLIAALLNVECTCGFTLGVTRDWHNPGCPYEKCRNILDTLEKRRERRRVDRGRP